MDRMILHLRQVNFFQYCMHIFNRPNGKLPAPHSCHFLLRFVSLFVLFVGLYFFSLFFFAMWMRHYVGWLYLFSLLPSIPFITDQMRECVCVRAPGKMYCVLFYFYFPLSVSCSLYSIEFANLFFFLAYIAGLFHTYMPRSIASISTRVNICSSNISITCDLHQSHLIQNNALKRMLFRPCPFHMKNHFQEPIKSVFSGKILTNKKVNENRCTELNNNICRMNAVTFHGHTKRVYCV